MIDWQVSARERFWSREPVTLKQLESQCGAAVPLLPMANTLRQQSNVIRPKPIH
jgi:hypothetical protein